MTWAALASLFAFTPARADDDYLQLWHTGRYADALRAVERQVADAGRRYATQIREDHAELLFLNGRVDDAITAQEDLVRRLPFPSHLLRLAELYKYRGRLDAYAVTLRRAASQARVLSEYGVGPDEWIAMGRIYELEGTDAKAVLTHLQRLTDQYNNSLDGHIAVGDLSVRKRAWDMASRSYLRALEIEPHNQDALAGLAECFHEAGDGRVAAVIDTLLELNPLHPRGRILLARRHLDMGEVEEADDQLDRVLGVNPVHREAVALRVAARFLDDEPARAASLRRNALAFNPHDSGVDRIPGRMASRHYRFEEGAAFQARALETDENDTEARFALALDLLRLGKDAEARAHLEAVFEADPYHVQAYNLLEVADVIQTFDTVGNDRTRIQSPELESRVLGSAMQELLDEAFARYQARYEVTLETPVTVQMFENHDEFMVRSVGLPGNAGHLGICFGRLITMDSPRARPGAATNWQQVLWHEFVHVVTLQKTRNRMPRWLSEGISVYEETERDAAWGQKLAPSFKAVLADAELPGLADLERFFTHPRSAQELMFGYYAAGRFVSFYVDRHGFPALVETLDRIGRGERADEALLASAGVTREQLDDAFRLHMAEETAPLAHLPSQEEGADPHESTFIDAIREGDRAAEKGEIGAAAAAYRKAQSLYPDHIGEDAPLRRLAALYADTDSTAYVRVLEEIVHQDLTAYAECMTLARLRARAGDLSGADAMLDRAFAIAPFHPETLRERTRIARTAGDLSGAEADLRRLLAVDTGRAAEHRLELARVLRNRSKVGDAKAEVIALLESMPHYYEAQQLLLDLVDAESGP